MDLNSPHSEDEISDEEISSIPTMKELSHIFTSEDECIEYLIEKKIFKAQKLCPVRTCRFHLRLDNKTKILLAKNARIVYQ